MRELNSVKKFSEQSTELYKAFKDYADNVLAVERGVKGKVFSDVSLDDKEKVINKLFAEEVAKRSNISVDAYNGEFKHYAENPVVRSFADAIFDSMIDMVLPEALNTSVGLIAEIDYVDWGDSAKFELENNALFNVAEAGYRQKNTLFQQLENTTVTLAPEPREVSVIATLFDLLTGRKSVAKYVMKAVKSIEIEMANEAWEAFQTAVSASTVPTALKVTTFTQDSAITLAETVTAWNNGKKAVFAGTPLALKNILPSNSNYRYSLDDAMVKLGYIPNFNTYDVIPTPNFADKNSTTYGLKLPNNKIYVVSPSADKPIKIVVGGTLSIPSGTYENANLAQTHTIMKAWKAGCVTNAIAGVITV